MTRHSPTAPAILESDLPPSAQELVRLLGWRGAMAVIREMAGARIYSPMRGAQWSAGSQARYARVVELAGEPAAERLYATFQGGLFEVPNCRHALIRARNRRLRAAFDRGTAIEQLCVDFGLSRRQVFYVLKQADSAAHSALPLRPAELDGQMGLF